LWDRWESPCTASWWPSIRFRAKRRKTTYFRTCKRPFEVPWISTCTASCLVVLVEQGILRTLIELYKRNNSNLLATPSNQETDNAANKRKQQSTLEHIHSYCTIPIVLSRARKLHTAGTFVLSPERAMFVPSPAHHKFIIPVYGMFKKVSCYPLHFLRCPSYNTIQYNTIQYSSFHDSTKH
jgi:hypothetical protein